MKHRNVLALALLIVAAAAGVWLLLTRPQSEPTTGAPHIPKLRLAIAPYQDMAMLAAAKPQSLDAKNGLDLQLVSMPWDELTPAVSGANAAVDVAFASLIQFITQEPNLNSNSSDPIVFFYPAYIFKGGAFVTFRPDVPVITRADLSNKTKLRAFLAHTFAVQKTSSYEILLFDLARRADVAFSEVSRFDMDSGDGLLAAINGSVDVSSAGLTQKNEALKRNGRVVLEMTALGQVDVAGFIAKRSTIESRRRELESMLRTWVDCIAYVMADVERNSTHSLDYLRRQSSTNYTIDEYRNALSQEWLPTRVDEIAAKVISAAGEYNYKEVVDSVSAYFINTGQLTSPAKNIEFIDIR